MQVDPVREAIHRNHPNTLFNHPALAEGRQPGGQGRRITWGDDLPQFPSQPVGGRRTQNTVDRR